MLGLTQHLIRLFVRALTCSVSQCQGKWHNSRLVVRRYEKSRTLVVCCLLQYRFIAKKHEKAFNIPIFNGRIE